MKSPRGEGKSASLKEESQGNLKAKVKDLGKKLQLHF